MLIQLRDDDGRMDANGWKSGYMNLLPPYMKGTPLLPLEEKALAYRRSQCRSFGAFGGDVFVGMCGKAQSKKKKTEKCRFWDDDEIFGDDNGWVRSLQPVGFLSALGAEGKGAHILVAWWGKPMHDWDPKSRAELQLSVMPRHKDNTAEASYPLYV